MKELFETIEAALAVAHEIKSKAPTGFIGNAISALRHAKDNLTWHQEAMDKKAAAEKAIADEAAKVAAAALLPAAAAPPAFAIIPAPPAPEPAAPESDTEQPTDANA